MAIRRAHGGDLDDVRTLLWSTEHSFTNTGDEDLASLLENGAAVVGETGSGRIWGFAILQAEARPPSLLAADPSRAYLRGIALSKRRSPIQDVPRLLREAEAWLPSDAGRLQLIAYGVGSWLNQPLAASRYSLIERVTFLRLENLQRRAFAVEGVDGLVLKRTQPADLVPLADLDAAAFDSIWHFDEKGLLTLLLSSTMVTAWWHDQMAGYVAIILQDDEEAFLARIAVDRAFRGKGIGRALLAHAAQQAKLTGIERITLNTQTDNQASQALYHVFGFRPTGRILPVFSRILDNSTHRP